jgi:hypothetical protein
MVKCSCLVSQYIENIKSRHQSALLFYFHQQFKRNNSSIPDLKFAASGKENTYFVISGPRRQVAASRAHRRPGKTPTVPRLIGSSSSAGKKLYMHMSNARTSLLLHANNTTCQKQS